MRIAALAAAGAATRPLLDSAPAAVPAGWAFDPTREIVPAPEDPSLWPEYRARLAAWRAAEKARLGYSDKLYGRADFAWARRCFACGFAMLNDETLLDGRRGRFTPEKFLEEGLREFGGYDALVLWHAYPRIGLDERNQFDFYRDQPGGLAGVRRLSRGLHRRGVRVFIDYNPWDTGTRREPQDDLTALAELVEAVEADGIFLDTMSQGSAAFRTALDARRAGVVLEGEIALPLAQIHDHHLSWAQWFADSPVPGVLRNKWFERRHLQHQIRRWDADHTGELHTAWMNGSGMMIWENVFGSWVGWSPRDRTILRSLLPSQRRYAHLFTGEGWTPLVPTLARGIYASLWEGADLRLWTLVNRAQAPVDAAWLSVELGPSERVFDLVAGREIEARRGATRVEVGGRIGPRGIGAVLVGAEVSLGRDFPRFLAAQQSIHDRASEDAPSPPRATRLRTCPPTAPPHALPPGMLEIPATSFTLNVGFRARECGFYESHPGNALANPGLHRPIVLSRPAKVGRCAIDLTPVTNAQYQAFLRGSRYRPRHAENFLRHWHDGRPPAGKEDHPVVYVDLEDARAYARWAGKRLPTEEEWQYAAQGPQGTQYPWGDEMLPNRCNGGETGDTTPVRAFPEGRSPFGCYDLCGNTWEWTESERADGRTRFCLLKGGSYYAAKGSDWYMDGGPRPNSFAAKFLLAWPGLDRCATIGFRCVVDLG